MRKKRIGMEENRKVKIIGRKIGKIIEKDENEKRSRMLKKGKKEKSSGIEEEGKKKKSEKSKGLKSKRKIGKWGEIEEFFGEVLKG